MANNSKSLFHTFCEIVLVRYMQIWSEANMAAITLWSYVYIRFE